MTRTGQELLGRLTAVYAAFCLLSLPMMAAEEPFRTLSPVGDSPHPAFCSYLDAPASSQPTGQMCTMSVRLNCRPPGILSYMRTTSADACVRTKLMSCKLKSGRTFVKPQNGPDNRQGLIRAGYSSSVGRMAEAVYSRH